MTDNPALLAAVAANPADDLPRLVYADWLDEHGQSERAEFIRVQIALVRSAFDSADRSKLAGRQTQLLKTWNTLLEPGDRELFDWASFRPVFSRGFLTEIVFPPHPRNRAVPSTQMVDTVGRCWRQACDLFTRSPLLWKVDCPAWFYLVVVPVATGGWIAKQVLLSAHPCRKCNGSGSTYYFGPDLPRTCGDCNGRGHAEEGRDFTTRKSRIELVEQVLLTEVARDLFGDFDLRSRP